MKYSYMPLICGALAISASTHAAEVNWSGFMSLVAGQTLDEDTTTDVGFIGYDATYDDSLRFDLDSVVALQGQVVANDKLRATVQLVGRGGNDFDIEAEWAYVSYDLTENLTLNAGRYRLPLYFYSDFLDVGYTYHWIRPPVEVYGGPSSTNGINLYYSNYIGDYEVSTQYWSGKAATEVAPGVDLVITDNGVNAQIGKDWWKVRGVFAQAQFDTDVAGVGIVNNNDIEFWGLSLNAEFSQFFARTEYTHLDFDGEETANWYATSGLILGNVTPHVSYISGERFDDPLADNITMIAGVSWTFNPNAVFKAELQQLDFDSDEREDSDLVSFGIDVIF